MTEEQRRLLMSGPHRRLVAVFSGVALLVAIGAAPGAHAASMLWVGPGGGTGACASPAYATIQPAVDAASSGDTIHVCAGTYDLGAAVAVDKDLSFVGDGAATTIVDGGGTVHLFDGPGRTLSISGLTLRDGHGDFGGAIDATFVNVASSTFSGNRADRYGGAIHASAAAHVTTSTFNGNRAGDGGAIYSAGSVTVGISTFTGNRAGRSGAIRGLPITVDRSTFAWNQTAGGPGGALDGNHVTATNSTFLGNGASEGGAINAFYATIANDTFDRNSGSGGAAHIDVEATLANSVISGLGYGIQCEGIIWDGGGNLVSGAMCPGIWTTAEALALGPLSDNGGPTQTIALGPTSVALDAGVDATCAAAPISGRDQRGVARPQGAHCDAGAFERVTFDPVPTVASFSPISGRVGTVVTLTGTNLSLVNGVTFNGLRATWSVRSPTTVVATVPVGATSGPIRVTTSHGTSAQSLGRFFVLP